MFTASPFLLAILIAQGVSDRSLCPRSQGGINVISFET
jgi:hypothetical protein